MTQNDITQQLKSYQCPILEQDLVSANCIKAIDVSNNNITLSLQFGFPTKGCEQKLTTPLKQFLQTQNPGFTIQVDLETKIQAHAVQPGLRAIPNVKNVIAVASAKGGVGKSTTAVNLALALKQLGAKVGILDADIHGPSIPTMLGVHQKPEINSDKHMLPVMAHGLQTMSVGFLIDTTTAMIWRGPMVSQALRQLTEQTAWDECDYLIVDLPPGTGDIQLTLAKKVPVSGAVIVTTPQDIAVLDARRGLEMFKKVNVAVLGVVENMSQFTCPSCGHHEAIFGAGGAEKMAETCNTCLLGSLPLDRHIQQQADSGNPTVIAEPDSALSQRYLDFALRTAAQLSLNPKNMAAKFPKIVVES